MAIERNGETSAKQLPAINECETESHDVSLDIFGMENKAFDKEETVTDINHTFENINKTEKSQISSFDVEKLQKCEVKKTVKSLKTLRKIVSPDYTMIPSKLSYILWGGYSGAYVPFINVFLTSIGLTISEAGFIGGMRTVSSCIAGPLWGFLADYSGQRKLIFAILCLGAASTIFSMPFVAREIKLSKKNITRYENTSPWQNASNELNVNKWSLANSTNEVYANFTPSNEGMDEKGDQMRYGFTCKLFYAMTIIIFISNIFDVPLQGFIDSFVMNIAKSSKKKTCFGAQRVFASVSFGVSNFLAGVAADHYYDPSLSKYAAVFYVFLPCILLLIPSGLYLLRQTKWPTKAVKCAENSASKSKHLIATFKNLDNLIFLCTVFLVGVASAVLLGFLFMLMDHEMNASKSIMGLTVLVSCLVQVLLFPVSDKIIRKLGAIICMEIAAFSYFVRFMIVSYVTNPLHIIPTQLFHCFGFALFWASAMEHTQNISPKEIYVTMYSIINSTYYGVGGLVGNIVGGIIFTHYGGRVLFRYTAILCGIWTLVMMLYHHVECVKNKSSKENVEVNVVDAIVWREEKWDNGMVCVRVHAPTI